MAPRWARASACAGCGGDAEALFRQVALEERAQALVVVDDQDVRGVRHGSRTGSVGHAGEHAAKAVDGGDAGFAEGGDEELALAGEETALESAAFLGQGEVFLAAVGVASGVFDVAFGDELTQDAGEALLGDAQKSEQLGHGDAGSGADEIENAVVGAAEAELFEDGVGGTGEVAVGEEEEFLHLAELFLAQEQQAGMCGRRAGRSDGGASRHLAKIRQVR